MEDLQRFAHRVKSLRKMKHVTKEEVCQDETELTVRQLTRIESGKSKPTLTKINFLADRLGMKIYELMPDYQDLPKEYLDIKYHLLRDVTYSDQQKREKKERQLALIYERYYQHLPEEEQLIINSMRLIFEVESRGMTPLEQQILQDYIQQVDRKEIYMVNDLLLIRLLMMRFLLEDQQVSLYQANLMPRLVTSLLETDYQLRVYQLFVLRDTLFVAVELCFYLEQGQYIRSLLDKLLEIMATTQDYQKKALLDMFEWKYQLKLAHNPKEAHRCYRRAVLCATLMEEQELLENLQEEWKNDQV